jgi:hypothetical protein
MSVRWKLLFHWNRVCDSTVFAVSGIDLGGPLYLRNKDKTWFVVFTCAVYRAVHFEILTSLSTEGFLLGLRRFIARRGRPDTIYTDNGTKFLGANNLMKKLDWEKITTSTSVRQLQRRERDSGKEVKVLWSKLQILIGGELFEYREGCIVRIQPTTRRIDQLQQPLASAVTNSQSNLS